MNPLAEGPQISGSVVLVILVALALALVAIGVLIWQGCVWARRAGRGDRTALTVWLGIAVIEVVLSVAGLVLVLGPVLVVQLALFLLARAKARGAADGRGPATPPPGSGRDWPTPQ